MSLTIDSVDNGRLLIAKILLELDLEAFDGPLGQIGDLVHATLPWIVLIIFVFDNADHDHEDIGLILWGSLRQRRCLTVKDVKLSLDAIRFLVLCGLIEAVAHDGDQHVQHRKHGEERGDKKEEDYKPLLIS